MSRDNSQTEITQQAPQKGPLLRGINGFLTLPVAPVVLVRIGSAGTQAAALLVTDMLSTVGIVLVAMAGAVITWREARESRELR